MDKVAPTVIITPGLGLTLYVVRTKDEGVCQLDQFSLPRSKAAEFHCDHALLATGI